MQTIEQMPSSSASTPPPPARRSAAGIARVIAVTALLALILLASAALLFTQPGQLLLHNPRYLRSDVAQFVLRHPIDAPLLYIAVYIVFGVLALPLWWLQILGGAAFGLPLGVAYTQLAATIGAVLAARFSHWLAAEWFHRLESHLQRLRALDEAFGKNAFLVVMAVRLAHVLPFGVTNYAFGLTTMRSRDIAWGTLLGGLPAVCTYVAIGVGGHPLSDWRYVVGIVILNAVLLVPPGVQYLLRRK
jgi:uncharacterized membrane protein YdjX (TVP38/TMEM64 family)